MPTERFYNLPDEKRIRIIKAAYEEMCRVSYDELSINKIIQKAEIPRGSFYQYFENKDDLLSYMMDDFQNQLFSVIRDHLIKNKGDIFKTFLSALDRMVAIGQQDKYCSLLKNVSCGIKANHVNAVHLFRRSGIDYSDEMYELVDKSRLNVHSKDEFLEIVYILAILMWTAGMEIFLDVSRKEIVLKRTEKRVNMLKYGVLKED